MALNSTDTGCAPSILAHLCAKNLRSRRWTRHDAEKWLCEMDQPLQQNVRDILNRIFNKSKPENEL
jgi:hypothetical protein